MKRIKTYRKILIAALILNVMAIFAWSYYLIKERIPDQIHVRVGCEQKFDFGLPLNATMHLEDESVMRINQEPLPENEITLNLRTPFSVNFIKHDSIDVALTFMGIPIKNITVSAIEEQMLMPVGAPVGIHIQTKGLMVLGTSELTDINGEKSSPAKNAVCSGDYIMSANNKPISTTNDMIEAIKNSGGKPLNLKLYRDGGEVDVSVLPVKTAQNEYKTGIWVRDDTQGIGTLSFIDENNRFAALGHGITDVDTGLLIDMSTGGLYPASIYSIVKGEAGTPGEMVGHILYGRSKKFADVTMNTNEGIFGTLNRLSPYRYDAVKALPVGLKQEMHIGNASIRCCIDGEIKEYEVKIASIDYNGSHKNKDFVLQITDEALLSKTNGIIQGMSGSPVIQDGKLVGVVTHVFLNDSSKGYGIFIENMLSNINRVQQ